MLAVCICVFGEAIAFFVVYSVAGSLRSVFGCCCVVLRVSFISAL